MRRLTAALGLIAFLSACSGGPGDQWPTETWVTSTPEEQGMDSTLLVEMLRDIVREEKPVHSVVVVRHGRLVLEAYFDPYRKQDRHIIYSATKSISAMLTGVAIADGLVGGEEESVLGLLPGYRDRLGPVGDMKRALELRHLLTMTAGLDWQDGPYGVREEGDFSRALAASDGVAYILEKAVVASPGSRYNYNSGCSHLLAAIVQEAAGQTALEYANARLFEPIGIRDAAWSEYQGINNGGSELFLRPRDMARLGHLVLRRGRWDGRQVVPEEWVDRMIQPQLKTNFEQMGEEYGYGWYTKRIDGHAVHSAEGLGGNGIYVVPALDLVVVFSGGLVGLEMLAPYRYLEEYILPAARSAVALPANPEMKRSLEDFQSRAHEPDTGSAQALPLMGESLSGRLYEVVDRENLLGIEELSLEFPTPGLGRIELAYSGTGKDADWGVDVVFRTDDLVANQRRVAVDFGLDGRSRTTIVEHDEIGRIPISAQGRWEDDGRLVLTVVNGWAIPETWTITLDEGEAISLTIDNPFFETTISGREQVGVSAPN